LSVNKQLTKIQNY